MRPIHICFLFCFFLGNAILQAQIVTREEVKKNKVKTVYKYNNTKDPSKRTLESVDRYDSLGRMTEEIMYGRRFGVERTKYIMNESGAVSCVLHFINDTLVDSTIYIPLPSPYYRYKSKTYSRGQLKSIETYTGDTLNRLRLVIRYSGTDSTIDSTKYFTRYADDGRVMTKSYYEISNRFKNHDTLEAEVTNYFNPNTYMVTEFYDGYFQECYEVRDNPDQHFSETFHYSQNMVLEESEIYYFNAKGKMTKRSTHYTKYNPRKKAKDYSVEYVYDTCGGLIKSIFYNEKGKVTKTDKYEHTYNSKGLITSSKQFGKKGEIEMFVELDYEYYP